MGKESSSTFSVMKLLNQTVSEPHYLFHFLTFFSYIVLRCSASQVLAPHLIQILIRREIQTLLAFAVLAFIKGIREETWEAFIADALFIAKICLFVLTFTMDRRIAVWYILVFLVIHVLTQQPSSQGLGTCSKLTPLLLESLLTEGNTTKFWLVEFSASYSSACIRSSQQFPELSITYSSKLLSFGIVDLGLFPNAAEKFGVSLSGSMGQLPTYILFENAAEVSRFPELGSETTFFNPTITKNAAEVSRFPELGSETTFFNPTITKNAAEVSRFPELGSETTFFNPTITKGLLSRHFGLDRHLLEYINGK